MAITLIEHYRPLVEMMVLSPTGRLVARQSMNEDIMSRFPRAWSPEASLTEYFLGFLANAAREARSAEAPSSPGTAPVSAQDAAASPSP